MPISDKKKISNSRYIAKCDSIQTAHQKNAATKSERPQPRRVKVCKVIFYRLVPKEWPVMDSPRRNPGKKGDYRGLLGESSSLLG